MKRVWFLVLLCGCELSTSGPTPEAAKKIGLAEAKVRDAPKDLDAKVALGEALAEGRQLFRAADYLRSVVEETPSAGKARAQLARVYEGLGYYESAFRELRSCLEADARQPECLLEMALFLRTDGSELALNESRRIAKRFLELAPNHPRHLEAEALIGELERALGAAGKKIDDSPLEEPPSAADSEAEADPHAGLDPNHAQGEAAPGPLNPFGQAFAKALDAGRKGDWAAAEAAYRQALAMRADDPTATAGLADALVRQGKVEPAVALAKALYERSRSDAQSVWLYGWTLIESGKDKAEGIKLLEQVKAMDPGLAADLSVDAAIEKAKR